MVKPTSQPSTLAMPPVAFDELSDEEASTTTPMICTLADFERELPGICQRIFETLGSQQSEATYQRCLSIDLLEAGVEKVHLEVELPLTYKGMVVSSRRADMIVELACGGRAILEFKALAKMMTLDHRRQLEYYLHHANIDEGYLINFPHDTGFPDVTTKSSFDYNGLAGLINHLTFGGPVLRLKNDPKRRQVEVVHIRRTDMDTPEASDTSVLDFMIPIRSNSRKSGSDSKSPEITDTGNMKEASSACVLDFMMPRVVTSTESGSGINSTETTAPPLSRFGITKKGEDCKICMKENRLCHLHNKPKEKTQSAADEDPVMLDEEDISNDSSMCQMAIIPKLARQKKA